MKAWVKAAMYELAFEFMTVDAVSRSALRSRRTSKRVFAMLHNRCRGGIICYSPSVVIPTKTMRERSAGGGRVSRGRGAPCRRPRKPHAHRGLSNRQLQL